MEWMDWKGKRIFVRLKTGKVYSGIIEDIDNSNKELIWISIRDKFGNKVTFVHSEIIEIKEEKNNA